MLKYSVSVYSILLGLSLTRAVYLGEDEGMTGMPNGGGMTGMPNGGMPGMPNADIQTLQNAIQRTGGEGVQNAACKAAMKKGPQQTVEGVSLLPQGYNPQEQGDRDVRSCIASKTYLLKNAVNTANEYIRNAVSKPVEKPCVSPMNKESHICFANKMVKDLLSKPIWTVGVHGNVVEVWFKKMLSDMFVMERPKYVIKKANERCLSFFENTQLQAVQNGLGNLLSITGSPAKGPSKSKECTPCGAKDPKTADGDNGPSCSDSCNTLGLLYNFSNSISTTSQSGKASKPKKKKTKTVKETKTSDDNNDSNS